jgi:chromosome segregation ATPase
MRYILGYFALVTGLSGLELIWAGSAYGFVLVVIAAVLIYVLVRMERTRRREKRYGGYGEAIEGYEKRFTDAEHSLQSKLPENVLDSPALVELLSAYEHDASQSEAIRREYAQLQQRFKDWRDEFDQLHALNESGAVGLPKEFAERYDQLDRQLSQLLADVKRLDSRAAEVDRATDDPLDQIAQGALLLEQA